MSVTRIPAALRRLVVERAHGQCEYCLTPATVAFAAHVIDHVIAEKHGGATVADNLAFPCALCNQHKGTDIASLNPLTGELTPLYHPGATAGLTILRCGVRN